MITNRLKNSITRKRLLRFKEVKRAYYSLWLLITLYILSLCSELICNNIPLYVKFNDKSYFPVVKFYPENVFANNNKTTRPDYKKIENLPVFKDNSDNFMVFPPSPFSPYESINPESLSVSGDVTLTISPIPLMGTVNIRKDYSIARSSFFGFFIGKREKELKGIVLSDYFDIPHTLKTVVSLRFANKDAPRVSFRIKRFNKKDLIVALSGFTPRSRFPETVRLTFQETEKNKKSYQFVFKRDPDFIKTKVFNLNIESEIWDMISNQDKTRIADFVTKRFTGPVDPVKLSIMGRPYTASFSKADIRFPFPPSPGHPMGIDGAGRDVLARILYGLRIALTFGLLLVACSISIGIVAGALQGYYGGLIDISGQRIIEIWSALPFLYIMILMGSIYGRSFVLLLFCYGLFNWIGISYYIRAEFLRLRRQPFVEAAGCLGASSAKIIFKHILPNAMVPVITFFPFSLVGAIGSLAALDYLGFGLPPPTPSWGELMFQAQQYRWAWWLILYPSLALFIVMLCGVFVGEGIRNAYDPKRFTRIE